MVRRDRRSIASSLDLVSPVSALSQSVISCRKRGAEDYIGAYRLSIYTSILLTNGDYSDMLIEVEPRIASQSLFVEVIMPQWFAAQRRPGLRALRSHHRIGQAAPTSIRRRDCQRRGDGRQHRHRPRPLRRRRGARIPRSGNLPATMITDHSAVNAQATALAKKLGVTPADNAVSQSLLKRGEGGTGSARAPAGCGVRPGLHRRAKWPSIRRCSTHSTTCSSHQHPTRSSSSCS